MLWDIIRDFFVQNIFGGVDSLGNLHYVGIPSQLTDGTSNSVLDVWQGNSVYLNFSDNILMTDDISSIYNDTLNLMSLNDYLSTTFTIITFVILFIVACLFVRWCFRVFKGALKW